MEPVLVAVDMQNDFASEGGAFHKPRPSVGFVLNTVVPFLGERGAVVKEIVSDYRQPRPGDPRDCCRPGEWGYESVLPRSVVDGKPWVKAMNSPVWVREGGGDADARPGIPHPAPESFHEWMGEPREAVLFGLTLDRCILATAQELTYRGFTVKVLEEGTDTASGDAEEKEYLLSNPPLTYWAEPVAWETVKKML